MTARMHMTRRRAMRWGARAWCAVGVWGMGMAAGCAAHGPAWSARVVDGDGSGTGAVPVKALDAAAMMDAVAPRRLSVHALTRLERGAGEGGAWALVAHIELLDAAGHACKWPGVLRVTLEAPSMVAEDEGLRGKGEAGPDRQWVLDLTSVEANAGAFDWVTRTYRARLGPLPTWAERFAGGELRVTDLRVEAALLTWDASGAERVLEGSGRVTRPE